MTAHRSLVVWVGLAGALVIPTRVAAADPSADCEYLEISATSAKASFMDAGLEPLEKKLKKPPFTGWNSFKKLSDAHIALVKLKAETLKLREGAAQLLLRDRTDKKVDLTISIDGADGKRVLDNKQSVAVADWTVWGYNVKDDGHILALLCK